MRTGNNNFALRGEMVAPVKVDEPAPGSNPNSGNSLAESIIKLSPLAVVAVDPAGKVKGWNDAAERIFGWSEVELLGLPSPLSPLDGLSDVATGAESGRAQHQVVRKDGSVAVVTFASELLRDAAGTLLGAVAIFEDLTQRLEFERAVQASEERFSRAFNFSPWPMAINSIEDGRFIEVNPRLMEILGVPAESIIGRTPFELGIDSSPENKKRLRTAIEAGGSLPPTIVEMLVRGGEPRSLLFSAEAIDLYGKPCVLSTFEDITGKRRAEEEQARLQAEVQKAALEWRLTFDAVDYQIVLLDFSGRVLRLNRLAKETSGKGYWQIKGKPVESIAPGQPWQRAAEMAKAVVQSRTNRSCQVRDPDTLKTWDLTANVVAGPGERIILVARDITTTVELQETLRKTETMSAMGALVAGVAHEVRNPLFSISATLDAFEARFGEQADYRPYISVLRGELDRLNQLMQDLLEYGRPSVMEASKGSIKDAVKNAAASCATLANAAGVEIIESAEEDLPPVMMDRRRIIQVFHNLIANAVQHSRAGQSVKIEAAAERQDETVWIVCAVSDSGPGFAKEDLPRIFEPFFTKRRGGTGLGLSIVHRIVEEHDGELVASNYPSGGAVVKVRFKSADK